MLVAEWNFNSAIILFKKYYYILVILLNYMPDIVADGDNLGDHIATKSFKQIKGTDVASADAITLGFGGNTFDITGTTTINHINSTNWVIGSVVILHFDGAVTLTNNAGGLTGAECNILLSGDANFTTSAGDILTFVLHDSTSWQEISRNSVASIPDGSITNDKLDTGIDAVKIADGSVNNTEFQYINSLTSNAQTQIDAKASLSGATFTGTVNLSGNNLENIKNLHHNISSTTTVLDFTSNQLQTISISANTTFTTSNLAVGKSKTIKITTDGTLRTLTFPAWKFVGTKPADQAGSKVGILTITSFGTTDADCVAGYAVEE